MKLAQNQKRLKQVLQISMELLAYVGNYQVLRVLSSTPHHLVYKVRRQGKIHTLTLTPLGLSSTSNASQYSTCITRLLAKCQKYLQLSHPSLQKLSDIFVFRHAQAAYLAILGEYATEGDLLDFIQQDAENRLPQLRDIMVNLCEAVEYLYNQGIIHCNITPENIRRINGRYKIAFSTFSEVKWFNRGNKNSEQMKQGSGGSAKSLTSKGSQVGKPKKEQSPNGNAGDSSLYCVSPEMHEGISFSFQTDIWSLGVIFYQMLTGDQFKLQEEKPYLLGSISQTKLGRVKNGIMRWLLKEMVKAESEKRISAARARNILTSTDLFKEQQQEEEIIQYKQLIHFKLPIFYNFYRSSKDDLALTPKVPTQQNHIELTIDGFQVVIIDKPHISSIEFYLFSLAPSLSVHTEYKYESLPTTFLSVFASASECFSHLKQGTLTIITIDSTGNLILTMEKQLYLALKSKNNRIQDKINEIYKDQTDSSNMIILSRQQNSNNTKRTTESDLIYRQTVAEYGQDSPQALDILVQIRKAKLFEDRREEKFNELEQKELFSLMKKKASSERVIQEYSVLMQRYYITQDYTRCMQISQKILQFLQGQLTSYKTRPLGNLLACSQLLDDQDQKNKWQKVIKQQYYKWTLLCTIRTAMGLYLACEPYMVNQRIEEYEIIKTKMKKYIQLAQQQIKATQNLEVLLFNAIVHIINVIFVNSYQSLFDIGIMLLTKIHIQTKSNPYYEEYCYAIERRVRQIIVLTTSSIVRRRLQDWEAKNIDVSHHRHSSYDFTYH